MRIHLGGTLFFLMALLAGGGAAGQEETKPLVEWHGESRVRLEVNSFFQPGGTDNNENEYTFWGMRNRLSVEARAGNLSAFLQFQDTRLLNLPEGSVAGTGGALGTGAVYQTSNLGEDEGQTFLNQGYLKLDGLPWPGGAIRLGRFQYAVGNELLSEDPAMRWLKANRIAERLVGPFDWTHVGRRFDGIQAVFGGKKTGHGWNLTLTATHPTQGGFNVDGGETMTEVDLVTLSGTLARAGKARWLEANGFYIYSGDRREITVVDNRAASSRPNMGIQPVAIHTWGGNLMGGQALGPGRLDLLTWIALQSGEWTDNDHRAWAYAVEGGYEFQRIPWSPWLRAGWFHSSGDGDATDNDHESFFQILPTARIYALNPFYNLMNSKDLFLSFKLRPGKEWFLLSQWHELWLSNASDQWYFGAGAQHSRTLFGYAARASSGQTHLASVVDLQVGYTPTRWLTGSIYYAHVIGHEVVEGLFAANDEADYAYVEITVRF